MRNIDESLASTLAQNTTNLCLCWCFTLNDGRVFGATDHDRPVQINDLVYQPDSALQAGEFTSHTGLAPGQVASVGGLSTQFLTETDLDNGLWNDARVDVFRTDWSAPYQRIQIWSGRVGEVRRDGKRFQAELLSLKSVLERPIGRIYSRNCDAEIGDSRCGIDLSRAEYTGQGQVDAVLSSTRFNTSHLQGFTDGWFTRGRLLWTSGANAGAKLRITGHLRQSFRAEITLISAGAHPPAIGDAFTLTAGCDKTQATCLHKFANITNFRGFPHLPGNDVLIAGPKGNKQ